MIYKKLYRRVSIYQLVRFIVPYTSNMYTNGSYLVRIIEIQNWIFLNYMYSLNNWILFTSTCTSERIRLLIRSKWPTHIIDSSIAFMRVNSFSTYCALDHWRSGADSLIKFFLLSAWENLNIFLLYIKNPHRQAF